MHKTNLLFVITKLELGGAQKQLLSLIRGLDRRSFNLFLFTAKDGLLTKEAQAIDGLYVHRSSFLERPVNPVKDLLALAEIRSFIKKFNIEAVHTHSSKAGILGRIAARLSGVRVIVHTVHGWSFHEFQSPPVRSMSVWLERRAATFTDNIIVVSECDRSRGLEYAIAKPSVFEVIPYGIEKRLFEKRDESVRGEFGFESGDLVVGSIACLKHQKSPEDFVKLAATVRKMFPRVKFLLIGDGSLRPGIEKLVSKNGLDGQLVLAGWRSDIPRIMSAIDVFVLTSLWEGLPISVLEAMAASLPVVATDTGGIKEVISSGDNGFLVRTRDINLMTDYVVDLLRDEGLRRRIGSRGSASIEGRLGVEEMTRKTQGLYSAIISRKKGKLC